MLFTAVPAIINPDESLDSEISQRPVSIMSSDSDDVDCKRVFNIKSGKITKYITDEVLQSSKSPDGNKSILNEAFDENHNHRPSNENPTTTKPIMQISSCNELQSIGVKNVPLYEEKVCSIDLSSENETSLEKTNTPPSSIASQKSEETLLLSSTDEQTDTQDETPPPMRDISKKYLNSLVRSNSKPFILDDFNATPMISIQESPIEKISPNSSPRKVKSVADIRAEPDSNTFLSSEYPTLKERKIVSQFIEDFAKSVPNIAECTDGDFSVKIIGRKALSTKTIIDAEELAAAPKVKELKKLFDRTEEKTKVI